MPITNYNCLCISEILHLFRSQLIIDFPFVHSKFVNDSMLAAVFFPSLFTAAGTLASRSTLESFQDTNIFHSSPRAGYLLNFANTFRAKMSLLKANM